ncbi:MAG TPA: 50S ribosomal protein L11 methyltransferase [Polyangiaceae bacterium]|jgi:SAM-dependent methyltransferase
MTRTLTPTTLLRRAPGLVLHLEGDGRVRVWLGDRAVRGGVHTLAVLETFARPVAFEEAFRALGARRPGAEAAVDLTQTIFELWGAGVLREDQPDGPPLPAADFSTLSLHVAMLRDHARTTALLEAIRAVVRPGDVVLDLGTGSGILAAAAAQAGARHVYAIEARGVARVAREVFAKNGLAERITLLEGWSTQVSIPERADVLLSELIGDELLSERAVESIADARRRLLKPDARIVPSGARLVALPLTVPDDVLRRGALPSAILTEWRARYGVDLWPLADAVRTAKPCLFVQPHDARDWAAPVSPLPLATLDFRTLERSAHAGRVTEIAQARGRIDGVLVYNELALAPGLELSLHPARATPENHWKNPLYFTPAPLFVEPGDEVAVTFELGGPDDSTSVSIAKA